MKTLSLTLALLLALCFSADAHTREEIRAAYEAIETAGDQSPYAALPSVLAPYDAGALTDAARAEALDFLNFARWLAGLEPVTGSGIYDYQCQHGATLLAALDYVDHNAPRPTDMDGDFYDSAHIATTSGCIARFNWMRPTILREGVEYFLRDDGEENLGALGHRRWALNPAMAATGFGLANAKSGMSYVMMYAHDLGRPEARWDNVCWPAAGDFPAELIHDHLAWSVVLNPEAYDLGNLNPVVTLTEAGTGLRFQFRPADGAGDGFCALNLEGYGAGPCIIFRPDFTGTGFTDYLQNQRWHVRIDGLTDTDGAPRPLDYDVTMISLTVQDAVNVELSPLEATLAPGDTLALRADVIPAYADDLTVLWRSSDAAVATVDADGLVTTVAPGECEITATCSGGYEDRCRVTVTG
ncbi:MAG: Ig-like domain-containing protein [Clostridia bacterium]|nr:Ig-like domain-containing protein [Clostridia bacterium]